MRIESSSPDVPAPRDPEGEKLLELSLQAVVTGFESTGVRFTEFTKIHRISSRWAFFPLKTEVENSSKLTLSLVIPKTRLLEEPLKLVVSGRVDKTSEMGSIAGEGTVSLQLDRNFRIVPLAQAETFSL